ncbi:hypothetical protein VPH35_135519 [Triticum aestivum]
MKRQLQDRRVIGAKWKAKYPPHSLRRGDPPCINVSLDLINVTIGVGMVDAERSLIMALVNVLVKIFDGLYAGADLNVDVAIEHPQQVWVIRHNPSVVQHLPSDLSTPSIVSTPINWVRVLPL